MCEDLAAVGENKLQRRSHYGSPRKMNFPRFASLSRCQSVRAPGLAGKRNEAAWGCLIDYFYGAKQQDKNRSIDPATHLNEGLIFSLILIQSITDYRQRIIQPFHVRVVYIGAFPHQLLSHIQGLYERVERSMVVPREYTISTRIDVAEQHVALHGFTVTAEGIQAMPKRFLSIDMCGLVVAGTCVAYRTRVMHVAHADRIAVDDLTVRPGHVLAFVVVLQGRVQCCLVFVATDRR